MSTTITGDQSPLLSPTPGTKPQTYTPTKWERTNQFVIFQVYDILDAIYPFTPSHLKRLAVRQKTPNAPTYTIADQHYFPVQKGHVVSLARVAMILSYVSANKVKSRAQLEKTPEFQVAWDASLTFDDINVYSSPSFDVLQPLILTYNHSSAKPTIKDLTEEALSLTTPEQWMVVIAKRMLQLDLTIKQAHHILCEYWALQRIGRGLGSQVRVEFFSEPYVFEPEWTNHTLSPATRASFERHQSSSDRSMLHDIIKEMTTHQLSEATAVNKDEKSLEEQSRKSAAEFKCTIPYHQFDALPRSLCPTCNAKIHLYCPICLQWSAFKSTDEAKQFFDDHSTLSPNPLLALVSPPTTPQHPKLLQKIADEINAGKKADGNATPDPEAPPPTTTTALQPTQPTSRSQYSQFYSPLPQPQLSKLSEITPESIAALLPLTGLPLPLSIELVHHPGEKLQKSTGLHSCLVSPHQARLVSFPNDLPDYSEEDTVILFPTDDAYSPDEIDWTKYRHCLIVEATWNGTTAVLAHPKLKNLKKVKLHNYQTLFWRNQQFGSAFLATIEAIYYLCREVHMAMIKQHCITPSTIRIFDHIYQSVLNGNQDKTNHDQEHLLMEVEKQTKNYQYQGELDDLLFLFLLRLRRILGLYHNLDTSAPVDNTVAVVDSAATSPEQQQKKSSKFQPKTWILGLGGSNAIGATNPASIQGDVGQK